MLFQRNKLQLPKLSQTSYVNWYLEQFYMEIHVNICTLQSNNFFFFLSNNCEFQEPELQASSSASVTATSAQSASRRG